MTDLNSHLDQLEIPMFPPNDLGLRKLKRWLKTNGATEGEATRAIANHERLMRFHLNRSKGS